MIKEPGLENIEQIMDDTVSDFSKRQIFKRHQFLVRHSGRKS